jgi:tetratricopeptide (TPR) repeat protein
VLLGGAYDRGDLPMARAHPTPQTSPPHAPAQASIRVRRLAPALLVLLTALIYLPSIGGEFVWDDRQLIETNAQVQQIASLPRAFVTGFITDPALKASYYRPLATVSYMVDFLLWRDTPRGYHVTNVVLQALVCLLVYAVALVLLRNVWAALFAGALFAAHPVHSESVAWISGRTDVLAALMLLPSFLFYARYCERGTQRRWLLLSSLCLFLALLAKETVIVFPALWLVFGLAVGRRKRALALDAAGLTAAAAAYLLLRRIVVLGTLAPEVAIAARHRILAAPANLLEALRLLYVSGIGRPYHGLAFSMSMPAWRVAASWAALAVGLAGALRLWRRSRLATFTVAWAVAGVWPVLNLIQLPRLILAERLLFLGTIGACLTYGLAARALLSRAGKRATTALGVLALVAVGGWSACAVIGARPWRDGISLWTAVSQLADRHGGDGFWSYERAEYHANLSLLLYNAKRFDEALRSAVAATNIQPRYAGGHRAAGMALGALGRMEESLQEHRVALELGPNLPEVHSSFGVELIRFHRYEEALEQLRMAARLDPAGPAAYRAMGYAYTHLARWPEAVDSFGHAVQLLPGSLAARGEYASALLAAGERQRAIEQLELIAREGRGRPEGRTAQEQLGRLRGGPPP